MTNETDNVQTMFARSCDPACSGADPVVQMPALQR